MNIPYSLRCRTLEVEREKKKREGDTERDREKWTDMRFCWMDVGLSKDPRYLTHGKGSHYARIDEHTKSNKQQARPGDYLIGCFYPTVGKYLYV